MEGLSSKEGRQICPGVWFYPVAPVDMIESGLLLTREDFYLAAQAVGQNKGQGTYTFNYLVFSLEAHFSESRWFSTDTFYDLKNPALNRANSYYIECQSAVDLLAAYDEGEAMLIGFGPKTTELLRSALYDIDPEESFENI